MSHEPPNIPAEENTARRSHHDNNAAASDLVPMTVLTGCHGASKSTLLHRILTERPDRWYQKRPV